MLLGSALYLQILPCCQAVPPRYILASPGSQLFVSPRSFRGRSPKEHAIERFPSVDLTPQPYSPAVNNGTGLTPQGQELEQASLARSRSDGLTRYRQRTPRAAQANGSSSSEHLFSPFSPSTRSLRSPPYALSPASAGSVDSDLDMELGERRRLLSPRGQR